MKRSEMLNKLALAFIENQGGTTPIKFAEAMLKCCEDNGMLPPDTHRCFSHDCEHGPTHKWESE